VDKYNYGTYKNKVIHRWGMVLTLCQWIKKMWNVDNLWGKKLELSECQGTRYDGDNPHDTLLPYFSGFVFPHFTTTYGPHVYVNTTFSPLTLSGGPVFYYIYFPDKKGRFRTKRGETSLRVFYAPSTREQVCFVTPQRGDN